MEDMIVWEADVECTSCKGTGLYKGMAERGDSAVICSHCNGTGKEHIRHQYTRFNGRKLREDVKRVYKTAGGYGITDQDVMTSDRRIIEFSEAGVAYKDWIVRVLVYIRVWQNGEIRLLYALIVMELVNIRKNYNVYHRQE